MDFLWLFILYVFFLVLCVSVFCLLSGRSSSGLDSALQRAERVISLVSPTWLQRCISSCFHTRSGAFVFLHLILDMLVFAEYNWEVLDYSLELELNWMLVFLPYVLITGNLYYFYKCCTTDPGRVTAQNESLCIGVYKYDEIMFHHSNKCPTCDLMKPARSKHCGVCGSCIQRFDHHCVWVNNCIGALNIRYFLLYLLSLTLTAISLAAVMTAFLLQVVLLSHIMTAAYVDSEGHKEIASLAYVIQHLFLTFPRIVFTLGFLFLLILFLGGYTCFLWYLSITNRTTNEWFKARRIPGSPTGFSRGIVGNLKEIFQPYTLYKKER
ncbi:palmitoyltransferase ZDHHC4 isoform X1 [Bufo gargarizans]|uniref:palmitoyltransferase ZDHHC4 isoform X1 n=1 Tax=Bufo gargarizans TaxID=30331 RepID=UPI001CF194B8|nr:palmitoyltransferase ZDHHC4 isoform X1 [Bufo gargarizans]XP_044159826.1 palmitoyltransferase ZDHHC4 isoform X1 [Bufo gargarizans]